MRRGPYGYFAGFAALASCSGGGGGATPSPAGQNPALDAGAVVGASDADDADATGATPMTAPGVDASEVEASTEVDGAPMASAHGATLPYVEYEAESGTTNATRLGPSRAVNDADVFASIAGESSRREAVKLLGTGQYVRFTTRSVANSIVVRFVIPDSQDGAGLQATLGLYVAGKRMSSLALTSHFAWAYGNAQTTDATTNNPSDGLAHHFYDEVRRLLPADIPAGTTIALQQDASDTAAYYVIDRVDLEEVPVALAQPAGSLSVANYGAKGDGVTDDGQAIQSAINDAQSKGSSVWLPPGTYVDASTVLNVKNVTVRGSGMWRSTIEGAASRFVCGATTCKIFDLAILGATTLRASTQCRALGGQTASRSTAAPETPSRTISAPTRSRTRASWSTRSSRPIVSAERRRSRATRFFGREARCSISSGGR